MDIISALLIASTATNIAFDPFNIPNVKTTSISTYQEVPKIDKNSRGGNDDPELEPRHFIFVAWAYAYLPINMVIRASSHHEAWDIASYFIENVNKQFINKDSGSFSIAHMPEPSSNVDLHNFLAQRGNDGSLFILSRALLKTKL
jgi:hypothetical protein